MSSSEHEALAIIGLAGIYPGSTTVRQFFENVLHKRCFIRDLPNWLWDQSLFYSDDPTEPLKSYSRIGALIGDVDIDLIPFRIPPAVAAHMSLNQKLALICARDALIDSGYTEGSFDRERVGVIMAAVTGEGTESWMEAILLKRVRAKLESLASNPDQQRMLTELWESYNATNPTLPITEDTLPGGIGSLVAGRIASAFDLHGMNLTIDSACASSLAAVAMGMTALRTNACDMVIAGGVDMDMSVGAYITFSKINALSGTGSYPFDARSNGFVMGQGCGVLILKRYSDALRDGDQIYALIHSFGSSSDGGGKGITAPSTDGQLRALRRAYENTGLAPSDLDFIECHGTGTQVGDAEELLSVTRLMADTSFGPVRESPLPISSAKAMVGHLKTAAGTVGLFRAILAINSRVVPPQVNFEIPNPRMDWEESGLRVPTRPEPINKQQIKVGVSSLGFGGTNFHLVLGTSPKNAREPLVAVEDFVLPELPPLASDIAVVFPGQGSQYVGMLGSLRGDPDVEDLLYRADRIVLEISGRSMMDAIYPPNCRLDDQDNLDALEKILRATAIAQPAIFTVSAILFEKVCWTGLKPAMCIGHSLGEYTALYAAGVLSFEDAVRAVAIRGHMMETLAAEDAGSMAFVSTGREGAERLISMTEGYLTCANLNSYDQIVIAGETEAVKSLVEQAAVSGIPAKLLNVDRAFHSHFLQPCVDPVRKALQSLTLRYPAIPIPANMSKQVYPMADGTHRAGQPMNTEDRNRLIDLLSQQIDHPVDFVSQVEMSYEAGARRFIEIGPKNVLTRLIEDMLQGKPFAAFSLDRSHHDVRLALEGLSSELEQPLGTPRRPLPTRPQGVGVPVGQIAVSSKPLSASDIVRGVVAQVSGYDISQIDDDAEFERDLGIDTLKILQIVAQLRGKVLPRDFTNFRQATSVRKILTFSESAGETTLAIDNEEVRCYDYKTVQGNLATVVPLPGRGYRMIAGSGLDSWEMALPEWEELVDEESNQVLVIFPIPSSAEVLCRDTIPQLLSLLVGLADEPAADRSKAEVHLFSLGAGGGLGPAMFRALCGFVKSCQRDLPNLQFSYTHCDELQLNPEMVRRLLVSPVLGRWVRKDEVVEEGALLHRPIPSADPDELATLLGPDDLVLVTGGARGITARMVEYLLPRVGARFLLVGRKPHVEDWITTKGRGRVEYAAADLGDTNAVRNLGLATRGITLVIHAAGSVYSRPIREIKLPELEEVLGGKVLGLERVMGELDQTRLRGVINFSSIAAYFGDNSHPDYAAANGYLDGFRREGLPVLSIGWSAWAEVGMASRSGFTEFLELAGIEPIPVETGVEVFAGLLTEFLKEATPGTKNIVVRAGMAEGIFLARDPLREAMIAHLPDANAIGGQAFLVTNVMGCLPENIQKLPAAAELQNANLLPGLNLIIEGTGVLVMRLPLVASIGMTFLDQLFTTAEKEEMAQVEPAKRGPEKVAGKLAVKILAREALRLWHGTVHDLATFQVITSDKGVEVTSVGDPPPGPVLRGLHFSISHSEDIVCAAVASCPVGIDVERVCPLSSETTEEILGNLVIDEILRDGNLFSPSASVPTPQELPLVIFTQKEAVLKAAGVGIANGLDEVELAEFNLLTPLTAIYKGVRYRVFSLLEDGFAFSLACKDIPDKDTTASKQIASKPVAASIGQEGLWYLENMEGIGSTHCVAWSEQFNGNLNQQALVRSLQTIVERHESLRTIFREVDGYCQAEVLSFMDVTPILMDLSHAGAEAAQGELARRIDEEMNLRFDLSRGPLMRTILFRMGADEHILLMLFHHTVIDATSAYHLRRELAACYRAFTAGKQPSLVPLQIQYSDFAERQRLALTESRLAMHSAYWQEKLGGHPGVLDLLTDRPRAAIQTYRAGSVPLVIDNQLDREVDRLSGDLGVTPFVTYLAALQTLLMRWSNQDDIVVGTPFIGRDDPDTFPLIGYFVNILPLRVDLSGNPMFREVLPAVRSAVMEALEHQEFPFPKLVEILSPQRDAALPALFQVVLRLWAEEPEGVKFEGLTNVYTEFPPKEIAYDLSIVIGQGENEQLSRFEYNRDLFDPDTVRRMADGYVRLLEAVVVNPDLRLWEIPLLSDTERQKVIHNWNETQRPIPDQPVHGLFAEQAKRTPKAVALAWDHGQMTFEELNERSNQLAHHLQSLGVEAEEVVGLAMDRTPEMILSISGILKAGGAYLPIDPDDPQERLIYKLSDAGVRFILTRGKSSIRLPPIDAKILNLDDLKQVLGRESTKNPALNVKPDHLAYIMYTSGSTGKPKGVEILHHSIVRLVFGVEYAELDPDQRILSLAPLAFDASTFEIWGALLNGARCILYPEPVPTIEKLGKFLRRHSVTTLFLTTSLFNTIIDERPDILRGVKQLLTGGEAQSVAHVCRAIEQLPSTQITNVYGPTETTTFATFYPIPRSVDETWRTIPIGRPIGNTSVYVLDRSGEPAAVGVPGELHIGGLGLARDYLHQPSLTEAVFIPNPFQPEERTRLYKTGDIVRWLPDGNLEFLGRNDRQVKIRGHRIELDEVEAVLLKHPDVKEAAVVIETGGVGGKRLIAHLTPRRGKTLDAKNVLSFLRESLPAYMIPSRVEAAVSLPKLVSGKIDRKALISQSVANLQQDRMHTEPRNDLERDLVSMWEEILDMRPVGVDDNFFDLGGHSLLAVRLFATIARKISIKLPVSTILQFPTIADLADHMRRDGWSPGWQSLVPIQPDGSKKPLFCVHWAGGNVVIYHDLARCLAPDRPVYGLQAVGLDRMQLPYTCVEDMAAHYVKEILAFQGEGPYHLAGASMGGMIAFEMAQQLRELGADVGLVGLLDTEGEFTGKPLPVAKRVSLHADNIRGRTLIKKLAYLQERVLSRVNRWIYKEFIRAGGPLPRGMRNMREISYRAALNYQPRPYSGKVTMFRAKQRFPGKENDIFLGWDKVSRGGIEIHEVSGDHASMLVEPQVGELAGLLRVCLEADENSKVEKK
jgi:amino acid adenylation domain-containing protein